MLRASGPKPIESLCMGFPVQAQPLHINLCRPFHLAILLWNGQTALFIGAQLLRDLGDDRIHKNHRRRCGPFLFHAIHNEHAAHHAYLRRSQSDARCIIHGFKHILSQTLNRGGHLSHGRRRLFQARIGMDYYGAYCHSGVIFNADPQRNCRIKDYYRNLRAGPFLALDLWPFHSNLTRKY